MGLLEISHGKEVYKKPAIPDENFSFKEKTSEIRRFLLVLVAEGGLEPSTYRV